MQSAPLAFLLYLFSLQILSPVYASEDDFVIIKSRVVAELMKAEVEDDRVAGRISQIKRTYRRRS